MTSALDLGVFLSPEMTFITTRKTRLGLETWVEVVVIKFEVFAWILPCVQY